MLGYLPILNLVETKPTLERKFLVALDILNQFSFPKNIKPLYMATHFESKCNQRFSLRPSIKWSLFFNSSPLTDDLFLILIDANSDIIFAMNEKLEKL